MSEHRRKPGHWGIRLSLRADITAGSRLRYAIRRVASDVSFPEMAIDDLLLAATEAVSNALKYGSIAPDEALEACIHASRDMVIVRLYYEGEPFVFSGTNSVRCGNPAPGKCGHYLMSRNVDEIHYHFRKGRTLLRMVKLAR